MLFKKFADAVLSGFRGDRSLGLPSLDHSHGHGNAATDAHQTPQTHTGADRRGGKHAKKSEDDLLTIPGGPILIDNDTRNVCALFRNGRFLVLEGEGINSSVMSVPKIAREILGHSFPAKAAEFVSYEALRAVYQKYIEDADVEHGPIRNRLIHRINHAAENKVSDIHIIYDGQVAVVKYQKFSKLSTEIEKYHGQDAKALFNTLFYYADVSDSAPVANKNQTIAILRETKLPRGVQGIRGHYSYPAGGGYHIDLRIIFSATDLKHNKIKDLGLSVEDARPLYFALMQSSGLITFGAPTEHGKSHTQNICLFELHDRSNGQALILAIDDPPEIIDRRILQYDVRSDLAEADADPYVNIVPMTVRVNPAAVKLGEVRKKAAALAAHELSLTGKLCFTTLHTQTACTIPARYIEIGVPEDLAFDSTRHVLLASQRLVPSLCNNCKIKLVNAINQEDSESFDAIHAEFMEHYPHEIQNYYLRNPDGCEECRTELHIDDGYAKGNRTLYIETILTTPAFMKHLRSDVSEGREYWLSVMKGRSLRMKLHDAAVKGIVAVDDFLKVGTVTDLVFDLAASSKTPANTNTAALQSRPAREPTAVPRAALAPSKGTIQRRREAARLARLSRSTNMRGIAA